MRAGNSYCLRDNRLPSSFAICCSKICSLSRSCGSSTVHRREVWHVFRQSCIHASKTVRRVIVQLEVFSSSWHVQGWIQTCTSLAQHGDGMNSKSRHSGGTTAHLIVSVLPCADIRKALFSISIGSSLPKTFHALVHPAPPTVHTLRLGKTHDQSRSHISPKQGTLHNPFASHVVPGIDVPPTSVAVIVLPDHRNSPANSSHTWRNSCDILNCLAISSRVSRLSTREVKSVKRLNRLQRHSKIAAEPPDTKARTETSRRPRRRWLRRVASTRYPCTSDMKSPDVL